MIQRLDGLSSIMMYGTGSMASHTAMAMWFPDGKLYVLESQDNTFWPVRNIQKNLYEDWI